MPLSPWSRHGCMVHTTTTWKVWMKYTYVDSKRPLKMASCAALGISSPLDFVHRLAFYLTQRFGKWTCFRLQGKSGRHLLLICRRAKILRMLSERRSSFQNWKPNSLQFSVVFFDPCSKCRDSWLAQIIPRPVPSRFVSNLHSLTIWIFDEMH
jgi:hypothetical protein